jgi:hypothetical protein
MENKKEPQGSFLLFEFPVETGFAGIPVPLTRIDSAEAARPGYRRRTNNRRKNATYSFETAISTPLQRDCFKLVILTGIIR